MIVILMDYTVRVKCSIVYTTGQGLLDGVQVYIDTCIYFTKMLLVRKNQTQLSFMITLLSNNTSTHLHVTDEPNITDDVNFLYSSRSSIHGYLEL